MESNGTPFRGLIWGQLLAKIIERRFGVHNCCCTNPGGRCECSVKHADEAADDDAVKAMPTPPRPVCGMMPCGG